MKNCFQKILKKKIDGTSKKIFLFFEQVELEKNFQNQIFVKNACFKIFEKKTKLTVKSEQTTQSKIEG